MALLTVILMLWAVIIILKSKPENPGFYIENTLPLRGLLAVLIIVHHVSQRLTYGCPDISIMFRHVFGILHLCLHHCFGLCSKHGSPQFGKYLIRDIFGTGGGVISLLFPSVGKYSIVYFISTVLLSIILAYLLRKISKQIII